MRNAIIGCFLCTSLSTYSQVNGLYADFFGERITLHADGNFDHEWHFDMASSWTKGTWRISNDTIYLTTVLVLDTLTKSNKLDSMVLSMNKTSERIDEMTFISSLISGGGQNRVKPPSRLYYHKKKLYLLKPDGRPDTSKKRGHWSGKMYPTWYVKQSAHNNSYAQYQNRP